MIVIPFSQQTQVIPTQGLLYWQDFAQPNCYVSGSLRSSDLTNTAITGSFLGGLAYSPASASIAPNGGNTYVATNYATALGDATCIALYKSNGPLTGSNAYERVFDRVFTTGFWIGREAQTANRFGGGFIRPSSPFGIFDNSFTDGQFQMIGISRTGSTQKLWNKGTVVQTATGLSTALTNTSPVFIGRANDVTYSLNGFISACLIYNRELTPAEMTQIYQYYSLRLQI